jgi:hypothetical protein
MKNVIGSLSIAGLFVGFSIAEYIPLFPNSVGAIAVAATFAYFSARADALGDLLRYFL